jgi:hypothetical protein
MAEDLPAVQLCPELPWIASLLLVDFLKFHSDYVIRAASSCADVLPSCWNYLDAPGLCPFHMSSSTPSPRLPIVFLWAISS